jgi:hypothetical protein
MFAPISSALAALLLSLLAKNYQLLCTYIHIKLKVPELQVEDPRAKERELTRY